MTTQKLKHPRDFCLLSISLSLSVCLTCLLPDFHNQNEDVEGASFDEVSADKLSPWERKKHGKIGKNDPSRLLP